MHSDRYLGTDQQSLPLARELYEVMIQYPILSPHGHVDAALLLENKAFANPVELLITPDHYITRMLMSQGITYEQLSIPHVNGSRAARDPREIWQILAGNWRAFRSTPSRIWLQETLATLFGIDEIITPERADYLYDQIDEHLRDKEFLPQALFRRFGIEVLATTDGVSDSLENHTALAKLDLVGKIIPTLRPDDVSDPAQLHWSDSIRALSLSAGEDCQTFASFLAALRIRRKFFKAHGATATDHGVISAQTLNLPDVEKEKLFSELLKGEITATNAATFRAVMLLEHARMAADDGLVMQLHPGSCRSYSKEIADRYGRDQGFDIPLPTHFVRELQPLLDEVGFNPNFRMVLFTLDETTYSRELAPLAGAYPSLRLGPPWWFLDSLNGMERWRDAVIETAGFYNTVGFIDDTRAFCSIPVRHDVARRFDAGYLAREVARHRITKIEAFELAGDIAYNLTKNYFRL